MTLDQRILPLFPLNTVLFPYASLPLQVFEERYKTMLRDCLGADSRFGVALIKSGAEVGGPAVPHSVGTVAQIVQVNPADQGRLFVSVYGVQRFRIQEVTQQEPYMAARVELVEEGEGTPVPVARLKEVHEAFIRQVRLSLGLRGGWVGSAPVPRDPTAMSYYIATLFKLELAEKQALLEEPSTASRLDTELRLLRETSETLKARVAEELGLKRFSLQ